MKIYTNGKVECSVCDFIAYVKIDNPPANAIDKDVVNGLRECFDLLEAEKEVRAVIITGTGKVFAAGADIKEFLGWDTPEIAEELTKKGQDLFLQIEQYPAPVIAAMNGYALGGGLELALACDIRYAAETAKLGLPEVSLGIIPGYGGTQRLFRAIGIGKAKELIFSAQKICAQEACIVGLIQKVAPLDKLEEEVDFIAKKIAQNGPIAVREAKRCINTGRSVTLETGLQYELAGARRCFESQDKKEGVGAFIEKRTPVFKGK